MKTAPVLQARLLHKKRVSLFFAKKKRVKLSTTWGQNLFEMVLWFSYTVSGIPTFFIDKERKVWELCIKNTDTMRETDF